MRNATWSATAVGPTPCARRCAPARPGPSLPPPCGRAASPLVQTQGRLSFCSMHPYDALEAEILADRIFAGVVSDDFDTFDGLDDGQPDENDRYVARLALRDVEAEAQLVETLNERRTVVADGHDDAPAAAASLQRLARTAWMHKCRARAAATGAEWDPVVGPVAAGVVARADRAASAIARAAARAVTRAAIRARNSARARLGAPARLTYRRRTASPPRHRAPRVRRVRVSAVTSAGSGSDEPGPEPPGSRNEIRLPTGRWP